MTAEEKLNELGFYKLEDEDDINITWYIHKDNKDKFIGYHNQKKVYWTSEDYEPLEINYELHQAITMLLEENK